VTPLTELAAAFILLTRVKLPWTTSEDVPIANYVWALPLVGATVGVLGAAVYAVCSMAGIPPIVGAVWGLAAMIVFTGALHEDGLADTCDGFGGGRTRVRKLEIMRDSRIGSFGAIALILTLAVRAMAIGALVQPVRVLIALTTAGALARGAIIVLLLTLDPARTDGLAAGLCGSLTARALVGLGIAGMLALLLLPFGAALRAMLGALAAALVVAWISRRQIGGFTGDVLGASSVIAESVVLALLAGMVANL
jgi:adenosylcobinamide-GDP ribazoletransferase